MELSLKLLNFILLLELSKCVRKEGRSHGREDNSRALVTIYINMLTLSSDVSMPRRHW